MRPIPPKNALPSGRKAYQKTNTVREFSKNRGKRLSLWEYADDAESDGGAKISVVSVRVSDRGLAVPR